MKSLSQILFQNYNTIHALLTHKRLRVLFILDDI